MIHVANGVLLDEHNNIIFYNDGELCITEKEKRLLILLLGKENSTVKKDEINTAVWPERKGMVTENNLLQLVFRLRKKLAVCGLRNCLCTVSREGYQFNSVSINPPKEVQMDMTLSCVNKDIPKDRGGLLLFLFYTIIGLSFSLIFITTEISRCEGNLVMYLSIQKKYERFHFASKCLLDEMLLP